MNSNNYNNNITTSAFPIRPASGGRATIVPDKLDHPSDDDNRPYFVRPSFDSESRLIVLQITDVYTLEHFASFKTLLETVRKQSKSPVISVLTGDFLAPYLLSSVDRGNGMMRALNAIPLDYLTWGNHEADIDHRTVCRHVKNFRGTSWLNSNMVDHEAMEFQKEYHVIQIPSRDAAQTRRVGLCAVLSHDPALYDHFAPPGAFGGATITDPWEALRKYKDILENDEACDLVLPLEHLYVPDDHRTCREFDFPVVLSGHDHHKVDEVLDGTRLLKPGMNGVYATALEISWPTPDTTKPDITARFVRVQDYPPDPVLQQVNQDAYNVLLPMRNTELARIPKAFQPLSSNGSRERVTTMGKFICSLIKSSMNVRQRRLRVDVVLLMGGNIRGNMDYEPDSFFSLEALEAEIKADEVVAVVPMPGWLLQEGVEITHAGEPISGWMQYDVGVRQNEEGTVTHAAGQPLDVRRIYRVATKISDLTNGQSPPWTNYYTEHPELLPPKGAYVNIHAELMTYCARNLWRKLWESTGISGRFQEECNMDTEERLAVLDGSGDGTITVQDIHTALRERLGFSVDDREMTLAEFVHDYADRNGNGKVTIADLELFCEDMSEERDSWRLGFAQQSAPERMVSVEIVPEEELFEPLPE